MFILLQQGEGPSDSGQIQGLPGDILSCLPSCFRSSLARWNVSIWEEMNMTTVYASGVSIM